VALQLHRSNRSERLVDALAAVLRRPLHDPFAPDIVAVQSKGMERWLAFELSARLGVLANAKWPFPRHLLSQVLDAVLGEEPEAAEAFSEQAMTLSLAALLPSRLHEPGFEPLARYLARDRDGVLRVQLSSRLARAFDDYVVYRPALLQSFEAGEGGYEGALWRALVARHGSVHQAARVERLLRALGGASESTKAPQLPERVCVFGVASMPPLYLRALSALSARVETHLFVLAPCREYFVDAKRRRHATTATADAEVGHPLLASLGRLGRDLQWLLEEPFSSYHEREGLFEDPDQGCLLHALQSDMLALRDRGGPGAQPSELPPPRLPIRRDDDSIAIHVCHGPMREVEVLHDQLLNLFEQREVAPHEVVVMAPDIERYAPLVEAVFGAEVGRARIPFTVADRRARAALPVVHAMDLVLDALRSRMGASTVLDLLAVPCLAARAGVAQDELAELRVLVEQSGARAAIDADHRAELGLPRTQHHTWRFGLDRLLLGLAIEARPETLYAGLRPVEGGHGGEAELLGKLAAFCERLFALRARAATPQRLAGWAQLFSDLLAELVDGSRQHASEHAQIRTAFAELVLDAERAGFDEPIALPSVRALLQQRLDARLPARGLLGAGVTFCQLVPMRSIPFQVVCLLGMNDGDFPRPAAPISFERAAEHGKPQPGDRSARDDDRHMFLEAILCARRKLHLSYVGRGLGDDRVRPPSVVVAELIDALDRGFFPEGTSAAEPGERRRQLLGCIATQHRLHVFSSRYFDRHDARFYSYSQQACEAARALQASDRAPSVRRDLSVPDLPLEELDLEELVRWVTRPLSTFAEQRLGLYLREEAEPSPDREPLSLDGLASWQLGMELLAMRLRGVPMETAMFAVSAGGGVADGAHGALLLEAIAAHVEPLVERTRSARSGDRLPPALVSLVHEGVRIRGVLHDLYPGGQVVSSYSKSGASAEHAPYVRHVVRGYHVALQPLPAAASSALVCRLPPKKGDRRARDEDEDEDAGAATIVLPPLPDPRSALGALLALVRDARRAPLPFERACSWQYALAVFEGKPRGEALAVAEETWQRSLKEGYLDAYVLRFFPSFEALTAQRPNDFASVAERAFLPYLSCREIR
jgi:exodeoxyribonuclease V gamma subunit